MKKYLFTLLLIISRMLVNGQEKRMSLGLEQDVLPYLTGGYIGCMWGGIDHLRTRLLYVDVNMPEFVTADGFSNHHVISKAIVIDYFFQSDWSGPWISTGIVHWNNSIKETSSQTERHFDQVMLNGSLGYNKILIGRLYTGVWGGLHLRVSGANQIQFSESSYSVDRLFPEASMKLGWSFKI